MKKFAVLTVLLSLSLSLMSPAMAQTRPRRAPETAPGAASTTTQTTPTTQSNQQNTQQPDGGYYDPNNQRPTTAPVLKGSDGRPVTTPPTSSTGTPDPATAVPDGPQEIDEDEVIKVDTALVTLPVSVTDRDGKYIPNLKQKDFKIYEDGVEQDVAYFAPTEKPFTVALVMDMSGSTKNHLSEIQEAAITFVDQLRRDDKVMVISFDDDVRVLAEATSDRRRLRSAIQSSHANPGAGTALYEAVDFVLNQRLNRIDGRKAIVLFTDGVDTSSRMATYQSNVLDAEEDGALVYVLQYDTFNDVMAGGGGAPPPPPNGKRSILVAAIGAILKGGSVNVHGGNQRSQGTANTEEAYRRADSYLHAIADRTGARVERADSIQDLDKSFAIIAEELRRQYSLGYYPKTSSVAGSRHAVRVRVMKPNLAVKARNSYITGEQTGPKTNPQRLMGAAGQVR